MVRLTTDELLRQVDPAALDRAMIGVESNWNPHAVSPKGALGLAQAMPATARDPGYGVRPVNPLDAKDSLRFASEYRSAMGREFGGSPTLSLMAYNWGPGSVRKWLDAGADPAAIPEETRNHIGKIVKALQANQPQPQPEQVSGQSAEAQLVGSEGQDTLSNAERLARARQKMERARRLEAARKKLEAARAKQSGGAPAPQTDQVGTGEDVLRSIGEGITTGVAAIPGMFGDLAALGEAGTKWAERKLEGATGIDVPDWLTNQPLRNVFGVGLPGTEDIRGGLEDVGLDRYEPQTWAGDYAKTISEGVTSAAGGGGAAALLRGGTGQLGSRALQMGLKQRTPAATMLANEARKGVAIGAVSGFGEESARQIAGEDSVVAPIVGGLLGGAIATPTTMKWGNYLDGRHGAASAFDDLGVEPRIASAVVPDSRRVARGERKAVAFAPGQMRTAARQMETDVAAKGEEITGRLGTRPDPLSAGTSIQKAGGNWMADFRLTTNRNWKQVTDRMGGNSRVAIPNVMKMLGETEPRTLLPDGRSVPRDANVKGVGVDHPFPKGATTEADVRKVLLTAETERMGEKLMGLSRNGTLSFDEMRFLKKELGELIGSPGLMQTQNEAQLRKLYAAIVQDEHAAVAARGDPKLLKQFENAVAYHRDKSETVRRLWDNLIKSGITPERAYRWATTDMASGNTRLRHLIKNLDQPAKDALSGTVLYRMGRESPTTAGFDGAGFDPKKFLDNWNKISPQARETLFGKHKQLGHDLKLLGRAVDQMLGRGDVDTTGIKRYRDAPLAGNRTILESLRQFGTGSVVGGALGGAMGGNVYAGMVAGGAITGLGTFIRGRRTAMLMTNPRFIRWLATPKDERGLPAHIAALETIAATEPEIADAVREFHAYLEGRE